MQQESQERGAAAGDKRPTDPPVEFNDIFSLRKPKDAKAGLSSGLKSIAKGCLGGVMALVASPVIGGCTDGLRGACCGFLAGFAGCAVLPITGTAVGTAQIVRGILNTPEAIYESGQGKLWNQDLREWADPGCLAAQTDGSDEDDWTERLLMGAPSSRSRRKKRLAADDGAAGSSGSSSRGDAAPLGQEEDGDLYSLLGVDEDATDEEIKKQYYVLARRWHPDKCPGDADAKDRFQRLGEAYQVLSNPKLRAKYDAEGAAGLDTNSFVDSSVFFAVLFGNEKFNDYIGVLMISVAARYGKELNTKQMQKLQARREHTLMLHLSGLLQRHVDGDEAGFKEAMTAEAKSLGSASFGVLLLHTLGRVYSSQASIELGDLWSSTMGRISSTWTRIQSQIHAANSGLKVYRIHQGLQDVSREQDGAGQAAEGQGQQQTEEERRTRRLMEEDAMPVMLEAMWAANVVDIETTLVAVCGAVLKKQPGTDPGVHWARALALKELGDIFLAVEEPVEGNQTAKDHIEAAMIKTMHKQNGMEASAEDAE